MAPDAIGRLTPLETGPFFRGRKLGAWLTALRNVLGPAAPVLRARSPLFDPAYCPSWVGARDAPKQ